jgi:peptidoglycan/xylan/chitin deacetylase (PgdA/CDA1 family)
MKIKNIIRTSLISLSILSTLNATIYENGEDDSIDRWTITDSDPENALVENLYDNTIESKVISLSGASYDNQYRIGNLPNKSGAWNDTQNFNLLWSMKNSDGFLMDVLLKTEKGLRYIRYSDHDADNGIVDDNVIEQGVGSNASNGKWQNFSRDLESDLQEFEHCNHIISVNGIMIRGDCKVDNIELKESAYIEKDFTIYEDAEDEVISRWTISDNIPSGAVISNVVDTQKGSRVIQLQSADSYENQYTLGGGWNNLKHLNLKWDMKTTEGFIIDVVVASEKGERYLRYVDREESYKGVSDDEVIYHGLGYYTTDGNWHTFSRNLAKDLKEIEPDNNLLAVNSFTIRANGKLDNIELFGSLEKIYEDAEDNKTTRWRLYNEPNGATITNIYDVNQSSRVISLEGNGYANQYIIGGDIGEDEAWNNTKHSNIKWSMKNSEGFILYLTINTLEGVRYLKYFDGDFNQKNISGDEIYYGLGNGASDGEWHTFIRDISADLKKFESDNELISVEGLIVIGSTRIDDLELFNTLHPVEHKAGLALTFDDYAVDGWFDMNGFFEEYSVKPTFFISNFHELSIGQIDKLKALESSGAEIGCHTYSHEGIHRDYESDVNRIDEYINAQIVPALNNMKASGFNPESLAYPYGEHEEAYDNAVRAYLPYLRTTASDNNRQLYQLDEIFHQKGKHYNILAGDGVDNSYNNGIEEIKEAFIKARKNQEIVTLYGHKIVDLPDDNYSISPQKLEKIIKIAKDLGLEFYTFKEAYLLGN